MTSEIKFEGGRTENLRREFQERKEYKEYEGFKNFKTLDTHYKDFKYGLINRNYAPITLISDQTDESLNNFPDLADNVRVLPFVAEAFKDLRKNYTTYIENTRNPSVSYPKYIEGLRPKKGYVNFSTEFTRYSNYNMGIHKRHLINDPDIKDFDTFLEKFFKIFEERGAEFPITKSGFIISEHCSILTSGLCIELAEEEYEFDEPKGEMVTTSEFQCFADYANGHGFLIDKYVPWRIVADLNSDIMREYILSGQNVETSRALDKYESIYTTRSCYDDLYHMRRYLFDIYLLIHRKSEEIEGKSALPPIPAMPIPRLLDILFRARTIELDMKHKFNFTERQKIVDIYNQYGLRYTEGYIGQITADRLKEIYGPNDSTNSGY